MENGEKVKEKEKGVEGESESESEGGSGLFGCLCIFQGGRLPLKLYSVWKLAVGKETTVGRQRLFDDWINPSILYI